MATASRLPTGEPKLGLPADCQSALHRMQSIRLTWQEARGKRMIYMDWRGKKAGRQVRPTTLAVVVEGGF
jgi:hypothetical protein